MDINRLTKIFAALHWLGLLMALVGGYNVWSNDSLETSAMMLYATLIGLGLLMMGPYPIVLFIRWSQKKQD